MAVAGMDTKVLQYIMGHSEIEVTMNVYTHMNYERASAQMFELVDGVPEPKKAGPDWRLSRSAASFEDCFPLKQFPV